MESSVPQTPNSDRPDPRATRLDRLEQENADLRARLEEFRTRFEELEAIVRVLSCNLGWEPGTLGFPPDVTP